MMAKGDSIFENVSAVDPMAPLAPLPKTSVHLKGAGNEETQRTADAGCELGENDNPE
jgi:hypothetical protein